MVHNVFVWQKEKTICVRHQNQSHLPLNLSLHAPTAAAAPSSHCSNGTANTAMGGGPTGIISTISGGSAGGTGSNGVMVVTQQPHAQQHQPQSPSHNQPHYHNHNGGLHVPLQPIALHQHSHHHHQTALSPNHSHVSSFGAAAAAANGGPHNNSAYVPTYGVHRPATATPPTKVQQQQQQLQQIGNGVAKLVGREACGSVSPGMMGAGGGGGVTTTSTSAALNGSGTLLELSNASGPGCSPHELSTLV